ncbi:MULTISPECIES: hypothetical protein [unclassified Nostoc]|uniref:hypothetical protein n=1 Tax=unclassified Nostoc TaxID=2593658 RepID=UPI0025AAE14B|nr:MULTISPECIES: hypothetical protein [unclassified Nostoc]MDM9582460.1 hypothetical protein [Nostoc sp. GT001]MDZ7944651.1 hypothetical protein [Nostoc sp. EfeVER01]MDZ7993698.1 hypothetical protein [Nostoc sp. EspVER01]
MSTTPISATLAQTDRDAVLQAIATIKENLPFLVDSEAAMMPYKASFSGDILEV